MMSTDLPPVCDLRRLYYERRELESTVDELNC